MTTSGDDQLLGEKYFGPDKPVAVRQGNQVTIRFLPNPAQERVLKAFYHHDEVFFGAGVGTGKTYLFAYLAFLLVLANPGVKGIIASHQSGHCYSELRKPFLAFLIGAGLYAGENKTRQEIYCTNGAVVRYGSADRPSSFEGLNAGWALGDEIRFWKKQAYLFFISRVRVPCPKRFVGLSSTLDVSHWMAQEFRRTDMPTVYGTTLENVGYYVDQAYVDRLKRRLTKREFKQYVLAEWVSSKGGVYSEQFDEEESVKLFEINPAWPILMGVDFGVVCPAVVFAVEQNGILYAIDELMPDDTPTDQLALLIKKRIDERGWKNIGPMWVDKAGQQRGQARGERAIEILRKAKFKVRYTTRPRWVDRLRSTEEVRAMLQNAAGERSLFLHPRLRPSLEDRKTRGIYNSLLGLPWKKGMDVPDDKGIYTHACDALRYLVIGLASRNDFAGVRTHRAYQR